ncbi:MAG: amidohydrolase family protein [Phycisphaera sp.]|nr:amidohydrolase family protein [Phycisphaera sp.]
MSRREHRSMIIDAQTRIWPSVDRLGRESADIARRQQASRWIRESAEPGQLELDLDPIDAALVFGYRCERQDASIANEWVAEVVARSRGRLLGVAGIDPMSTDAIEELDRAVDMGFVGVTVCPSDQGFHPTNSTAMRLWERCQHLGLPVFVSRPGPPCPGAILEFDRPLNWDEVARSIPELSVVIGGIGSPWVEETLLLLQKHPRLFADTAGLVKRPWQLFQALLGASSMGITDKLLFASGWPAETPAKAIETIYSVNGFSHGTQLPSIPRPELRSIVERDLPTVLGMPIAPSAVLDKTTEPSSTTPPVPDEA